MDSFSITTDCIELGSTISRASLVLGEFVRQVREARSDLDTISRELHSLQSVLNLLAEDAGNLPSRLASRTPALLEQCNGVVSSLDACLLALDGSALSRPQKRMQWIAVGKQQIADLRGALEAHRAVMALVLDLVGATSSHSLCDTPDLVDGAMSEHEKHPAEIEREATRIIHEMAQLQAKFRHQFENEDYRPILETYCMALRLYATSLIHTGAAENGACAGEGLISGACSADGPDSAIEMDGSVSSFPSLCNATTGETGLGGRSTGRSGDSTADGYIQEVNQLMGEMFAPTRPPTPARSLSPTRTPTPPPKDVKRIERMRRSMVTPFYEPTAASTTSMEEAFGVVTEISSQGTRANRSSNKSKGVGRLFGHMRSAFSQSSPMSLVAGRDDSSSTRTGNSDDRPSTPIMQASLVRRGSHRLSMSVKRLPLWTTELEEPEGPASPGSNAVFGVSLQKSIQAARSSAKTHHSGSGSSRREFPLCIHKCCVFLQREGVAAPDIFAEPGDPYRVQKLKETFSTPPTYGEAVNWDNFGVYDAADVVLLFLSQLPKPLVSESLAKRWISLSRQASLGGQHATRPDQCIDFWEEALGGLRSAQRSLFKLLLNLWAAVADAEAENDMAAERLAGVVLKPLIHTSSAKHGTDYMLALAFLIRKRSEYTMMLHEGRASRAAFVGSSI